MSDFVEPGEAVGATGRRQFVVTPQEEEAEQALMEINEFEAAHAVLPRIIRTGKH